MHELSITQSIMDVVLEEAEKASAKEVKKINLVIGEMSGIVEQSVNFYFGFLNKGTVAEGATLNFNMVPTTAKCHNCGKDFELKELDWCCPHCQSTSFDIIAGKELYIESIEVD
jgi:hydrogenase nickel incorporation protein HypA/HybF